MLLIPALAIIFQNMWIGDTIRTFNVYTTVYITLAILVIGYALAIMGTLVYDLKVKQNIKKEIRQGYIRFVIYKAVSQILILAVFYIICVTIAMKLGGMK